MTRRSYKVDMGEREAEVVLPAASEGMRQLQIDGEELLLEACSLPDGGYSVRLADGSMYRVDVSEDGDALSLRVRGRSRRLTAISERDTWLRSRKDGRRGQGGLLTVSMPGKVVKILKAVGDSVETGEGVLIIEAMKMENEVRADMEGVIVEISVSLGDNIEAGESLARIDAVQGGSDD